MRARVTVRGTVKFFDPVRFFGFIRGDDGQEYFLHGRNLIGAPRRHDDYVNFSIAEGTPCEFEVQPSLDGREPIAVHVRLGRNPHAP